MITSQLEIIEQAKLYLSSVNQTDYNAILAPNFASSAGSHIRHILDHYLAVINGFDNQLINYDIRHRGCLSEKNPEIALTKFDHISIWLKTLSKDDLNRELLLSTEVSITSKKVQTIPTSLIRELLFVGAHAVHHYATIAQICKAQTTSLPESFGIAPATATFLRQHNLYQS
jgi:hypothetical protein